MAEGNNNKGWVIGLGIAVGFLILWLAYDRDKAYKLLEKSKKKEGDLEKENQILFSANTELVEVVHEYEENLSSLKEMIRNNDQLEGEVKKKLTSLIDTYKGIDSKVSNELTAAMALIEAKQPTKAAFSLAKIVENLLEEKYSQNGEFKEFIKNKNNGKKRNPVFNDYLEYAKDQKLIEQDEFHFAKGLKEIRNQEGHELDVKKHENWIATAFFTGIGLIMKLGEGIGRTAVA
ncbi:MAG: hypothetical protein RLZZ198_1141 [Bacteroidota bacterium]|jgi:hypothetical protein